MSVIQNAHNLYLAAGTTATTQAAGDNTTLVATDAFVTGAIATAVAGINPAVAVQWATTAAASTSGLTYANGASGIGATFTGANNTATTIDGHTFVTGDVGITRLLVKNDTQSPSGAFNGVYLFTALHTSITGDIFTRALDYDQPSDINNTGAIPVVNGTVNAATTWLQTANIITVGTTPLVYVQFSYNPSSIVTTFSAGSTGLTPSSATSGAITLAGTLAAANGGTGNATNTAHAVMLGEGTSALGFATIGTAGRVLTDQGAGADPVFAAPIYPPYYLKKLNLSWLSTSGISVSIGSAIDSTNATNMTLASSTTISTGTLGALSGMDQITLAGTVATSTANATVTGSSTSFLTAFGTRAATGTITSSAAAVTGVGTLFLSQVAINDLIGNSTSGYFQVTAVTSNTALTINATPATPFSTSTVAVIENPLIQVNSQTVQRVIKIASNTSLTLGANSSATVASGGTAYAGGIYAGDAATNAFYQAFLVVQSGTTGVILSTQRTTPYMTLSSFRRLGGVVCDKSGNIIPFVQRGVDNDREMTLYMAANANGSGLWSNVGSTSSAFVSASGEGSQPSVIIPPSANMVIISVYTNGGNIIGVRASNVGAAFTNGAKWATGDGSGGTLYAECDGAQNIDIATATTGNYVSVMGWKESL